MKIFAFVRTLAYIVVFLIAWGWAASAVRRFDPAIGVSLPSWLSVPGYLIFAAGLAGLVFCVLVLPLRGLGTPAPFDASRRLVVVGPYRFVRNPVYVTGILALAGYAFAVRSVSVLLLAVAAWLLTHALVVLYEEPHLRRVFGEGYERYMRAVNRWLPRRPRPPAGGA
jgi:protein-S-isoprenylcysteine O-methyltransferase Ste14